MSLNKQKIGGAIYILPNLLTTGNMFFGFFSVVNSLQGNFKVAGASILLASVFDMLDGRIARLTNSTSEFGVQYDSLCDLISFGMAPAFLAYQFALSGVGRVGWLVCFFYLACGAMRLARFNVQASIGQGHGDFTGLPIPMAAAVIATMVLLVDNIIGGNLVDRFYTTGFVRDLFGNEAFVRGLLLVCTPGLGLVMVSNFRYRSHKSIKVSVIKPFKLLVLLVVLISCIAFEPELLGFLFFGGYFISGPLEYILGWKKMTEDDDIFESISGSSSMEPTGSKTDGQS